MPERKKDLRAALSRKPEGERRLLHLARSGERGENKQAGKGEENVESAKTPVQEGEPSLREKKRRRKSWGTKQQCEGKKGERVGEKIYYRRPKKYASH